MRLLNFSSILAILRLHTWALHDKTVVVLGVRDREELEDWEHRLLKERLDHATFIEPDFDAGKTAIAVKPHENAGRVLSSVRLL
jgi:hypothetical protein